MIKSKGDALYRQVVPDPAELEENEGAADPLRRRRTSLICGLQVAIQTDFLDDLQRLIAGQSSILAQRFEDPDDR